MAAYEQEVKSRAMNTLRQQLEEGRKAAGEGDSFQMPTPIRLYRDLEGMIDLHIHSVPDGFPRLMDDIEVVSQAKAVKMRAVMLKGHVTATPDRAYIAQRAVGGGIEVYGMICLNTPVGGMNPEAVKMAIRMGAKAVWMPSMWAENHARYVRETRKNMGYETTGMQFPEPGETILTSDGRIKPEVKEILKLIADHDLMLSTGHLTLQESHLLLDEAKRMRIKKLIVHTVNYHVLHYPLDDQKQMVEKGVEFHDGRKLRAQDVNYSLRRVMDPKTGSASRPLLGDVDPNGIKVEDEHTIRVKLTRSNSDFPVVLFDFRLQIIPEDFTDFDHAIGTGPFKVKVWKPGVRCVAERNPNYWKSDLPLVDEVETFAIPDKVARVNALLAGEIHLMAMLDPGLLDKIKATPSVKVMASKSGNQIGFVMNCTTPPYDNVDVRLALKHLVDREKYLQTVYKGLGQIANDHPIPPLSKDYCTSIPIRKYDPEKAKTLLKKAGVLDYTFELYSTDAFAGAMEGALVYSQMASKAGVKIKVIRSPADGYWDAIWLKKPFCATQWNTRPAIMALRFAFLSDASMNETSWKRPKFDQLFLETMATMEESKRKNLFCEMQRMIHDDGGLILPVFPHILDACSVKVKGLIENPFSSMGGWKFAETAWLEG